ncbi:methyl-accepting chemotaxis protein [Paenibacillus oryzisoli]|uniref:Chemotaxis protein n=1 Tax=Paenibacillus oryzisoli TaxID=1850517 RepID=A0A198A8U0_9BACL|nr:methyl-accepting chemotaxis protein [Paenibacillus oryzisoli]OAS17884.1 chemotaxis protein [Paenibacillus oryzisoli]
MKLKSWFTSNNVHSVKSKLVLYFSIILLLPSLFVGWTSFKTAKTKIDHQMEQSASASIILLNQTINQMIEARMKDVDILAQELNAGELGTNQGNQKLKGVLDRFKAAHPEIENVYVGNAETGRAIASPIIDFASDYDARERDWYIRATANKGEAVVSDPLISLTTQNVAVSIAKATQDGHGVVGMNLNLTKLSQITKDVKIGQQGYVVIYDRSQKYLVHPTAKIGEVATEDYVKKQFASDSGSLEYTMLPEKKLKKAVFVTNALTGWKLSGTWFQSEVTKEAAPILNKTILVIVIALLAGSVLIFFMIPSITRPLKLLSDTSVSVAQGDLSQRFNVKSKDEFGQLGKSFNYMIDSLRAVLFEVSQSSSQLAASSEQLTASAEQTSQATEHIAGAIEKTANGATQQVQRVEESSKIINEVSASVEQIARSTESVAEKATNAAEKSFEGGQAIKKAVGQMSSISSSVDGLAVVVCGLARTSQEIDQITGAITDIAQQTNLLSLNASIEAARAGEHGRGFGVVANEVKKLAEQSSKSAEQIAMLINTIRNEIDQAQYSMLTATKEVRVGIEVVQTAGDLFHEIETFVNEVGTQVREVAAAAQQISAGTSMVVQSIQEIDDIAESTSAETQNISSAAEEQLASMEEITASSEALTHMAGELQTWVEKFKL